MRSTIDGQWMQFNVVHVIWSGVYISSWQLNSTDDWCQIPAFQRQRTEAACSSFSNHKLVLTSENADLNLLLYWVCNWPIPGAEVFPSLKRVVHATSALSGMTAVCAMEFDNHFQLHTSSNQQPHCLWRLRLTPAASLSVPLASNCYSTPAMCTHYNVSKL